MSNPPIPWEGKPPAEVVELLRNDLGFSKDRLAEELGTSRRTVIRWTKHNAGISPLYRRRLARLSEAEANSLGPIPQTAFAKRVLTNDEIGSFIKAVEKLQRQVAEIQERGGESVTSPQIVERLSAIEATLRALPRLVSERGEDGDLGEARRKAQDLPKLDDSQPPAKEKRDTQ